MMSWLARAVLGLAAVITGWFVADDAPNRDLWEMTIGILLIALFVAAAALGPSIIRAFRRPGGTDA